MQPHKYNESQQIQSPTDVMGSDSRYVLVEQERDVERDKPRPLSIRLVEIPRSTVHHTESVSHGSRPTHAAASEIHTISIIRGSACVWRTRASGSSPLHIVRSDRGGESDAAV